MKITSATSLFITLVYLSFSLTKVLVDARLGDEIDHDQIVNEEVTAHDLHSRYLAAHNGDSIEGHFIVTVPDRADIPTVLEELSKRMPACRVVKVYEYVLSGFVVYDASPAQMNRFIHAMESLGVDITVAEDVVIEAFRNVDNKRWGLDRIDERDLPLDGKFVQDSGLNGLNVDIYILDTGVRGDHQDFRRSNGSSRVNTGPNFSTDSTPSNVDQNGHGTHVASIAAGNAYGVAPGANIWAVKVLRSTNSGDASSSIDALEWVEARHRSNNGRKSVVNMSLGTFSFPALDSAVNHAVSQGVVVVTSAGNSMFDACWFSPARAANAITVGSTDRNDSRSSFSNFGSCVDIFAPGRDITAAVNSTSTSIGQKSGTSMSSPHVAGAVALLLQSESLSPNQVVARLKAVSTQGKVVNRGSGSPDKLLYVGSFSNSCRYSQCVTNNDCCPSSPNCFDGRCLIECNVGFCTEPDTCCGEYNCNNFRCQTSPVPPPPPAPRPQPTPRPPTRPSQPIYNGPTRDGPRCPTCDIP